MSSNKPRCSTCDFFDTSEAKSFGGFEAQRLYSRREEDGGVCRKAATPFRQPGNNVCGCYEGPALPKLGLFAVFHELRARRSLAQEALDNLALTRDDAAVLRCALAGVWRRSTEARLRSHELWAELRPVLDGHILSENYKLSEDVAAKWRDKFINVTVAISRILKSLGDMALLEPIRELGIKDVGILLPERDTGRACERCGAALNTVEHLDPATKEIICRGCAEKIGLFGGRGDTK